MTTAWPVAAVIGEAPTLSDRIAIAVDVARTHADAVDRDGRFPAEAVAAMRSQGLLGCSVPAAFGGEELDLRELASIAERLGGACSSSGMVFAMHHSQVLSITRHLGTSTALGDLARAIVRDQLLVASATTEVGIGGDTGSSSCFVDHLDGRIRLAKNTPVISYGEDADLILVTARRAADAAPNDQVLLVCDRAFTLLDPTGTWDTLGLRGTRSLGFRLLADVDASRLVPDAYEQISTETMLPVAHVLWAAVWLGMARAAVDTARRYVRAQARRSIGTVPQGATALVHLLAELEQLEVLVDSAGRDFDMISDDREALGRIGFAISMNNLKVTSSTMLARIVGEALLLTGISGYRNDGPYSLGRLFRDAQGAAIMVHNDRITANTARMLLVSKGGHSR